MLAFTKSRAPGDGLFNGPDAGIEIVTRPRANNSPATRHTSSLGITNAWQAICKVVWPSASVKSRHCSGVSCIRGFRSRRADRSVGVSTICGCKNEVSIRIGATGLVACCGGVSVVVANDNRSVFLTNSGPATSDENKIGVDEALSLGSSKNCEASCNVGGWGIVFLGFGCACTPVEDVPALIG